MIIAQPKMNILWREVFDTMQTLRKQDLSGHDVFEFMQGEYNDIHWNEDSIYLTEDTLSQTELLAALTGSLEHFNYYGPTEVSKEDWNTIKEKLDVTTSKDTKSLISEIDDWASECFKGQLYFTILGP